ncbi:hypothetical protein QN277_022864 [Acacia crassicarpa]|uniref:Uncharacterized protein n=1 Tax=Acacia crassicarpa TaxID=499986 RepID=A0AAE1KAI5_9FABA|nr:hypothetical protein QN277_022864 [Acacia crassicarpa]
MGDQNHWKLPPDWPFNILACGSKKNKKNDSLRKLIPWNMTLLKLGCKTRQKHPRYIPYKDSLLGFNRIANGGSNVEDEELLYDVLNKEWEMKKLIEEVHALMPHHPMVPVIVDEYGEGCKPWNTSLIITLLEHEGLELICFSCGRYSNCKENCQWTYAKSSKKSLEQLQAPSPIVAKASPTKQTLKGEESFGMWMIVGSSNRARSSRRNYTIGAPSKQGKGLRNVRINKIG